LQHVRYIGKWQYGIVGVKVVDLLGERVIGKLTAARDIKGVVRDAMIHDDEDLVPVDVAD